jgi:DNA-binding NarL/FixJ family response regulator
MEIVGEADNGGEAVARYLELRPSVVVMDLLLPDMDGADAIRQICTRSSDAHIVVLTTVAGDAEIYRCLEAGARGYLFKDMARKELVQAIRHVDDGQRYVPPAVGARLAESIPLQGLSPREIQVLQLVAAGQRNKEIAYELNLSETTVNAHIKHILEKLHASDRTQAVTTALRRSIIKL